jgi:hypothetical protein
MKTSSESFAEFLGGAWLLLTRQERLRPERKLSVPMVLQRLYDMAAAPNDERAGVKDVVSGAALSAAMANYVDPTIGYPIRLQMRPRWLTLTDKAAKLEVDYQMAARGEQPQFADDIERTAYARMPKGYLHVYPKQPGAKAGWRLGLNVLPVSMPAAMTALVPLLDRFPDIGHIKFLGPGSAVKCDSVIVYLARKDATYPALRDAVCAAAEALQLQPCVGGIWNEYRPGIGEASEPPKEHELYTSFTSYRCLIVYLAYWFYVPVRGAVSFAAFKDYLRALMPLFGLDYDAPHIQNPVPPALTEEGSSFYLDAYLALKKAWKA